MAQGFSFGARIGLGKSLKRAPASSPGLRVLRLGLGQEFLLLLLGEGVVAVGVVGGLTFRYRRAHHRRCFGPMSMSVKLWVWVSGLGGESRLDFWDLAVSKG